MVVASELLRRDVLRSLRAAFVKKSKKQKGGGSGCASAFDKWHFGVLRRAQEDDDPLVPANLRISDLLDTEKLLADELVAEGLGRASAEAVAVWHRKQYVKAAKTLCKKIQRRGKGAGDTPVLCSPASTEGLLTLSHGDDVRVQIHAAQLAKLRALSAQSGGDDARFLLATLCLLLRYQALGGGGFQCAIPPPVFSCLEELWGITCEGFASPFNCRMSARRYCSAFPDTDDCFGSLGSFFKLTASDALQQGAFELNPPFSLELYSALLVHCHALLDEAEQQKAPLSFAVIVGATQPALAHSALREYSQSRFLTGQLVVGVGEHVYLCGGARDDFETDTFRACDTGVYILQSTEAAARSPTTTQKLEQLARAFRHTNGLAKTSKSPPSTAASSSSSKPNSKPSNKSSSHPASHGNLANRNGNNLANSSGSSSNLANISGSGSNLANSNQLNRGSQGSMPGGKTSSKRGTGAETSPVAQTHARSTKRSKS